MTKVITSTCEEKTVRDSILDKFYDALAVAAALLLLPISLLGWSKQETTWHW